MFRPQPTPYAASFAAYGRRDEFGGGGGGGSDFNSVDFQQAQLALFGLGVGGSSSSCLLGPGAPAPAQAQPQQQLQLAGPLGGQQQHQQQPGYSTTPAAFRPVAAHAQAHIGHHHHHHQHLNPQPHHPHSSGAAGAAPSSSAFGCQQHQRNHHHHHHVHSRHDAIANSPTIKMEPAAQDDLAAQEAAAREYQPQLEGPLVGDKITSHAITDEYAKADPIYVEKTIALPQTYSHYRPIQGDGNCGWRAIGFSYFETLILTATQAKIAAELQRIASLNQYLQDVGGYNAYVWEDMVEETAAILTDIAARLADPDAALAALQAKFNDPAVSNAVIYHLRLLAASYLKGHPHDYEPFIPNPGGVQAYCASTLEPSDREIDHLGITLLVEVLLKPAGFVLEIAYLDRSPGAQANIYRFPAETTGQDEATLGPMIYLLFRPDHYDILYKPPPPPVDLRINRVASFSQPLQAAPSGVAACGPVNYDILTMLPAFGLVPQNNDMDPLAMHTLALSSRPPPMDDPYPPPGSQPPPSWGLPSFQETLPLRHTPAPSTSPVSSVTTPPHQQPPPLTQLQQPGPPPSLSPSPTATTHPLRFSKYSYPNKTPEGIADVKPVEDQAQAFSAAAAEQQTMTTAAFKNSHFNVAHYNNPHFQPEEYRPGDDDTAEGAGIAPRRRKKDKGVKVQPPDHDE